MHNDSFSIEIGQLLHDHQPVSGKTQLQIYSHLYFKEGYLQSFL